MQSCDQAARGDLLPSTLGPNALNAWYSRRKPSRWPPPIGGAQPSPPFWRCTAVTSLLEVHSRHFARPKTPEKKKRDCDPHILLRETKRRTSGRLRGGVARGPSFPRLETSDLVCLWRECGPVWLTSRKADGVQRRADGVQRRRERWLAAPSTLRLTSKREKAGTAGAMLSFLSV